MRLLRYAKPRLSALAAVLATLAFVAPVHAQTGQVTGRAVQSETGSPLTGAEVRVAGTSIRTTTGSNGRYLLTAVPAGTQTLELAFLGRESATETVTVTAGQVSVVDFTVSVAPVAIEGIDVLGVRAMTQARALSEQQNAANIINVVASDQIGRFPDASAPEACSWAPTVSGTSAPTTWNRRDGISGTRGWATTSWRSSRPGTTPSRVSASGAPPRWTTV